jgi:nucleoside-diphosphate-sugar epimerase
LARILVTGAGGFIGRGLCRGLVARGHQVIAGMRRAPAEPEPALEHCEPRVLGNIAPGRRWGGELRDADIVIHLAQRAHRRASDRDLADEPEAAAALLRAAAANAGRFVYLSSIKAMGEMTLPGQAFRADDQPRPQDAYGRAKLATEQTLIRAAREAAIDLVVARPPLVYGPGVGGNFRALLRLVESGLPLPFAGLDNRRSLLARDNLVDLLAVAALHPAAAGRVWLAADGEDLSTADLVRILARGQGRVARLFTLPDPVFAILRSLPGLGPAVRRLTQSLQVDAAPTRTNLGWSPPVPVEAALRATARAFREANPDEANPGAIGGV